jgi:hypothetical protein
MKTFHPVPPPRILAIALSLWSLAALAHVEGGMASGF